MPRQEHCPYDPADRASRCHACVVANNSLTPCVTGWLNEATGSRRAAATFVTIVDLDSVRTWRRAA